MRHGPLWPSTELVEPGAFGAERRDGTGPIARPPGQASILEHEGCAKARFCVGGWPARTGTGRDRAVVWSATSTGLTRLRGTSNSACGRAPGFSASTMSSPTPIIEMPGFMLLQILAGWPAPASPQWTTRPASVQARLVPGEGLGRSAAEGEGSASRPPTRRRPARDRQPCGARCDGIACRADSDVDGGGIR